jgi:hypothetical protein
LFILQLIQPRCYTSLATQNHCYNETRTRLTARSRSLLTASSLLLNVEIYPLIVELRGLVQEHLVQGFSFVFNSALASVASESNNSVSVVARTCFLFSNTFILFLASGYTWKTLFEPLPGNRRLCCFFLFQYSCFYALFTERCSAMVFNKPLSSDGHHRILLSDTTSHYVLILAATAIPLTTNFLKPGVVSTGKYHRRLERVCCRLA